MLRVNKLDQRPTPHRLVHYRLSAFLTAMIEAAASIHRSQKTKPPISTIASTSRLDLRQCRQRTTCASAVGSANLRAVSARRDSRFERSAIAAHNSERGGPARVRPEKRRAAFLEAGAKHGSRASSVRDTPSCGTQGGAIAERGREIERRQATQNRSRRATGFDALGLGHFQEPIVQMVTARGGSRRVRACARGAREADHERHSGECARTP
jgi:hypothetical protein